MCTRLSYAINATAVLYRNNINNNNNLCIPTDTILYKFQVGKKVRLDLNGIIEW